MGLLEGKRVVVTGAGAGIGRAVCLRMRAEGATVTAVDIDETALASLAAETGVATAAADVSDASVLGPVLAGAATQLGVSTAWSTTPVWERWPTCTGTATDGSTRSSTSTWAVPSTGYGPPFPSWKRRGRDDRERGLGEWDATDARRSRLLGGQSRCHRPDEFGRSRIRADHQGQLCLSRGHRHPLTAPLLVDSRARELIAQGTPLGRIGTAAEVADVIVFLCSDLAAYVTGVNIPVDGGSLLPSAQVDAVLQGILDQMNQKN